MFLVSSIFSAGQGILRMILQETGLWKRVPKVDVSLCFCICLCRYLTELCNKISGSVIQVTEGFWTCLV